MCLGKTPTRHNCMHEEIKSRLHSRRACCHSVQNLLSSRLESKNTEGSNGDRGLIHVCIIGWQHRLGLMGSRWQGTVQRSVMSGTAHQMLVTWSNQGGCDGYGMWHVRGEENECRVLWGNLYARDHLKCLGVYGRIILKGRVKTKRLNDVDWFNVTENRADRRVLWAR